MKNFFGRCIFVIVLLTSGFLGVSIAQEDVVLPVQDNIDLSKNTENKEAVIEEKTLSIPPETDSAGRNEFYNTIEQYSPVKAYIERVEAVVNSRNFEKAWELTADSLKQELFEGLFETFIKFPEKMLMSTGLYHIRSVEFKTPEKVKIQMVFDALMVKEGGEWKYAGRDKDND